METLYNTMTELSQQLYVAVKALLMSKGIKPTSDVVKSIEVRATDKTIQLLAEQYLEYLSTGRKPGAKRIPIRYLLDFIKQNKLQGRKQTLQAVTFAIATAISKRRGSNKKPPTAALTQWVKDNIALRPMTDNQLAFALQTSIYRSGIKGRNFWSTMEKLFADMSEEKISGDAEKMILASLDELKLN
jgi:hypothetical protein